MGASAAGSSAAGVSAYGVEDSCSEAGGDPTTRVSIMNASSVGDSSICPSGRSVAASSAAGVSARCVAPASAVGSSGGVRGDVDCTPPSETCSDHWVPSQ